MCVYVCVVFMVLSSFNPFSKMLMSKSQKKKKTHTHTVPKQFCAHSTLSQLNFSFYLIVEFVKRRHYHRCQSRRKREKRFELEKKPPRKSCKKSISCCQKNGFIWHLVAWQAELAVTFNTYPLKLARQMKRNKNRQLHGSNNSTTTTYTFTARNENGNQKEKARLQCCKRIYFHCVFHHPKCHIYFYYYTYVQS